MSEQPAEVWALERLLVRRKALGEVLLSLDAYDRWGNGCDPAFEQEAQQAVPEHAEVTRQLTALAEQTRAAQPEVMRRWGQAHVALLTAYLATATDGTAAFVAKEEREQWEQVAAGERLYVEENTYYVHPDPADHLRIFGTPPE